MITTKKNGEQETRGGRGQEVLYGLIERWEKYIERTTKTEVARGEGKISRSKKKITPRGNPSTYG